MVKVRRTFQLARVHWTFAIGECPVGETRIKHILSAADQLNLSKLKVFNLNDEIALLYFTTKLPFRRIFQEQITDPILAFVNHFNEIS
ncbi:unnamed protein product, partial [Rotaria sp. Silwood1]